MSEREKQREDAAPRELDETNESEREPKDDAGEEWQTWTPPRGPLTKIVAWLILLMVLAGTGVMVLYVAGC